MVEAIVGNIKTWDEIQQNFDHLLSRDPHALEREPNPQPPIFDGFYGLPIDLSDGRTFVVYFDVNDTDRRITLLEAHVV